MTGLTVSIPLGYPSSIPGSGVDVKNAYFVLTEHFFLKTKIDHVVSVDKVIGIFIVGFLSC